jgi:hypothetical protein
MMLLSLVLTYKFAAVSEHKGVIAMPQPIFEFANVLVSVGERLNAFACDGVKLEFARVGSAIYKRSCALPVAHPIFKFSDVEIAFRVRLGASTIRPCRRCCVRRARW